MNEAYIRTHLEVETEGERVPRSVAQVLSEIAAHEACLRNLRAEVRAMRSGVSHYVPDSQYVPSYVAKDSYAEPYKHVSVVPHVRPLEEVLSDAYVEGVVREMNVANAAPAMLEALKRVRETGAFLGGVASVMVDDAIARAEGDL